MVWAFYPDRKKTPEIDFVSRFSFIALVSLFRAFQDNRFKLGIIDAPKTFEGMRKEFANLGDICRVRAWVLKIDNSQFNDNKLEMIRILLQESLRELVINGDVDLTYTGYDPARDDYNVITITEVKDEIGDGYIRIDAVFVLNKQSYDYCHKKLYGNFRKGADSSDEDF